MNLTYCNSTLDYEQINETPIFGDWTFHKLGLWLCAAFGLFATLLSAYSMLMHATHYLKPYEQRHIIRILFMVPIYSVVSFLSYRYYIHAIYFDVLMNCYEAFAIASFFALLCHYIAPDLHSQKDYFRGLHPRPWVWPISWMQKCCGGGERGCLRTPRSGLTLFNIIWLGVFQYCFIRVFMTVVAVVTQVTGRYCQDSLSPAFAHVWVVCIEGLCVSIAMYCLIQFYVQIRNDVSEHKPFIKVLAIKLVIFLSFWQTLTINFLTSSNVIKESPRIGTPDVKIGIPALLLCIEMAIFSVLHLFAYPWQVYDVHRSAIVASEGGPDLQFENHRTYQGGPLGLYAFLDAFNPWDLVKAVARGFRWAAVGRKHREKDPSYQPHLQGTSPGGTPFGIGSKTSRYEQLHDNVSDLEVPLSHPGTEPYAQGGFPSSGDLGKVSAVGRSEESGDELRTMHPIPKEYGGVEEDTGYHGAQADPRGQWGNPGKAL